MSASSAPSILLSILLFIGVGLLGLATAENGNHGLLGLLLGAAAVLIYRLNHRLHLVERRISKLEGSASPVGVISSGQASPSRPTETALPVAAFAEPQRVRDTGGISPPTVEVISAGKDSASSAAVHPQMLKAPTSTFLERGVAASLNWLLNGNALARAGVVTLFVGGSFLAKYAVEHSMFPIGLRMALLGAGALGLLAIGWLLREARPGYAQTLQGGGIAGFYLTVFAATRLYHLLPQPAALALMVSIVLCAAILAVFQNALALAVIGTGGGFLAPILLSADQGSLVALFSYYTVLNIGVFIVAWFRAWRVLNLVGFVFTFGIAGLFRATTYAPQQQFTMEFFLWAFFVLYVAVSVLFSLRQKPELKGYVSSSLVFGLPLAVFTLHTSIIGYGGLGLAWSALGLALFYLALATVLLKARIENLGVLGEAFAALGVIFATIAISLGFDRGATGMAWAVEGAGLVWLGVRQDRRLARGFGLLLQLASGVGYLQIVLPLRTANPMLDGPFVNSVSLAVAGFLSGLWLFRRRDKRADYELHFDAIAAIWGIGWWFDGGLKEILRYSAENYWLGAEMGFAALTIAVLAWLAGRLLWPLLIRIAISVTLLTVLRSLSEVTQWSHPFAQGAWAGWVLLLAATYWTLWCSEQADDALIESIRRPLHAGCVWLVAALAAWELSWQTGREIGGVWRDLPWGAVPALALVWLSRRRMIPAWPLAREEQTYRVLAAAPLSVWCAIWAIAINLGSDGSPGGLPYLPLLNPLDVTVMFVFTAQGLHWASLSTGQRAGLTPADARVLPGLAAGTVFLWLNAALIRALHYLAGTPFTLEGISHSIIVQAALSIFWGLLAFGTIALAARRGRRDAWIAGAGLMAVLLVKLFMVDTAGRGTLARIASFLVVGALLLLAGYVSPLPPRKPADPEPAK